MYQSRFKQLYTVPYVAWILLFVIIPIILVGYYSFTDYEGHFTLSHYANFFTSTYLTLALYSFFYAVIITVITLLIAYPTAYILTKTKYKELWLLFIIIPSWLNLLLKTYAFIGLLSKNGLVAAVIQSFGIEAPQLLFTSMSFILVAVYIFIPFMILPIFNAMNELNPTFIEAARDLGASRWTTFRKVVLPLTADGIKAGIQVTFIPALSLFMVTRLIAGNKVMTLGTAIEQQFLVTQNWGMGSAIAMFLIVTMFLVMKVTTTKEGGGR